jgi:hypothetical protein
MFKGMVVGGQKTFNNFHKSKISLFHYYAWQFHFILSRVSTGRIKKQVKIKLCVIFDINSLTLASDAFKFYF